MSNRPHLSSPQLQMFIPARELMKMDSSDASAVTTPDGAFTKTGGNATLAGIPGSGDEGCYAYAGGTGNFSFIPASSAVPAANSTRTSILLAGTNTFIGYGSLQKEYEILSILEFALWFLVPPIMWALGSFKLKEKASQWEAFFLAFRH